MVFSLERSYRILPEERRNSRSILAFLFSHRKRSFSLDSLVVDLKKVDPTRIRKVYPIPRVD